jgi:hypothetical protein
MGFDPKGVPSGVAAEERLNIFALVVYIPGALGRFLDGLRRELAPHYDPRAHVSVLPPRPLAVEWQTASEQIRAWTEGWAPFDIELGGIQVFPVTDVVYIETGAGASELLRMHAAMNSGALEFREPFPYQPHITLAQEIPHPDIETVHELAQRRWKEFRGERGFRAKRAVLVRNTLHDCWIDLAEYSLGGVAAR